MQLVAVSFDVILNKDSIDQWRGESRFFVILGKQNNKPPRFKLGGFLCLEIYLGLRQHSQNLITSVPLRLKRFF